MQVSAAVLQRQTSNIQTGNRLCNRTACSMSAHSLDTRPAYVAAWCPRPAAARQQRDGRGQRQVSAGAGFGAQPRHQARPPKLGAGEPEPCGARQGADAPRRHPRRTRSLKRRARPCSAHSGRRACLCALASRVARIRAQVLNHGAHGAHAFFSQSRPSLVSQARPSLVCQARPSLAQYPSIGMLASWLLTTWRVKALDARPWRPWRARLPFRQHATPRHVLMLIVTHASASLRATRRAPRRRCSATAPTCLLHKRARIADGPINGP